ncbi:aquaporin-9-like isoform X2 [Littorina saxatilis]|uniref:Aquaporin-3 n=1 Tax=Littorina saxatilis TaxID=31220 RepID=A0AAN9C285_9CAEN
MFKMTLRIRDRPLMRECLAEFLGTFILMVFGTGVGAQFLLSHGKISSPVAGSMTWGIGVMMGIYVSGGVSGGHINPAVSVAMATLGRLPWYKVPGYCLAQCLGSFAASGFVYLVYWEALDAFDGGFRQVDGTNGTAGIWSTYPQPYVSIWTCLGDQIFATAVLLICVMGISDPQNMQPPTGLFPVSIGLLVMALSMSYSLNCGNAMNPARDFIPRIFTALAGWELTPLRYRNYNFFWVNIIGPHIGAVLGAYIYQAFIGFHWPLPPSVDIPIGDLDNDQEKPWSEKEREARRGNSGSTNSNHTKGVTSEHDKCMKIASINKAFEMPEDATRM